eukprot:EG_transcript_18429
MEGIRALFIDPGESSSEDDRMVVDAELPASPRAFLQLFRQSLGGDGPTPELRLSRAAVQRLLPTFVRFAGQCVAYESARTDAPCDEWQLHCVELFHAVTMALLKCDFPALADTEHFDTLHALCDVLLHYCFLLLSQLVAWMPTMQQTLLPRPAADLYTQLGTVVRVLLTNHPHRHVVRSGAPASPTPPPVPFPFEVAARGPEEPSGAADRPEQQRSHSPRLPTSPPDLRAVAQYLLRRPATGSGVPVSPALPASPAPNIAALSPGSPSRNPARRSGLPTLVQHNLLYAVTVLGTPVSRILEAAACLLTPAVLEPPGDAERQEARAAQVAL